MASGAATLLESTDQLHDRRHGRVPDGVQTRANALRLRGLRPVMDEGTTGGTPRGAGRPGVIPATQEVRA